MGSFFRMMRENSARIKKQVNKYLQNRKSGLHMSKMQGFDIMSVFLEDQQMFPDEKIVDNLLVVMFAPTRMLHYVS